MAWGQKSALDSPNDEVSYRPFTEVTNLAAGRKTEVCRHEERDEEVGDWGKEETERRKSQTCTS